MQLSWVLLDQDLGGREIEVKLSARTVALSEAGLGGVTSMLTDMAFERPQNIHFQVHSCGCW